jgi:LacI family transcriptional regulator
MRRIALCMELSDFYEHGIARGLVRYAKAKPDWQLYGYGWMFRPLSDLTAWEGDGIIARVESAERADLLASLGLPVVDVAGAYSRRHFSSVTNDDILTGFNAGTHLLERGFSSFAFLGVKGTRWSELRFRGFERSIAEARGGASGRSGRPAARRVAVPAFERPLSWWEGLTDRSPRGKDLDELGAFMRSLPAPTALFACNDTTGLRATELAGRLGIDIPESLAILGVDNEDILCELASPSLSSVMLDCEAIGYRAAELLDGIFEGAKPRAEGAVVSPREIIERESTRIFACGDELVARAVTIIRARAQEGIGVADLLGSLPASRRSLETRFRAAMGRSIHEEILRSRIAYAKRLLRGGDDTIDAVAERSGFGSAQRFHEAFKKLEGLAPGTWRRQSRGR